MKQIKFSYLFFLFFFLALGAVEAQISNTQVNFSCTGLVTVTYDLISDHRPVDVELYYSRNKCDWNLAEAVTGDLTAQTTGNGKEIIWDSYADSIRSGKFYFKVEMLPEPPCEGVMINDVCWATRNLNVGGVFSENPEDYGTLYQWGRKTDGHENRTSPSYPTNNISEENGVINAIELDADGQIPNTHPAYGKFVKQKNDPGDWRAPQDNALWNSGTGKTVNDPCPYGWRVPTHAELQTLTQTTYVTRMWTTENGINGYCFTDNDTGNSIFLPAAGYRNSTNGAIFSVGVVGLYWSSTPNGIESHCLYFYSGYASPNPAYYRTYGGSIRCVSEY